MNCDYLLKTIFLKHFVLGIVGVFCGSVLARLVTALVGWYCCGGRRVRETTNSAHHQIATLAIEAHQLTGRVLDAERVLRDLLCSERNSQREREESAFLSGLRRSELLPALPTTQPITQAAAQPPAVTFSSQEQLPSAQRFSTGTVSTVLGSCSSLEAGQEQRQAAQILSFNGRDAYAPFQAPIHPPAYELDKFTVDV